MSLLEEGKLKDFKPLIVLIMLSRGLVTGVIAGAFELTVQISTGLIFFTMIVTGCLSVTRSRVGWQAGSKESGAERRGIVMVC